LSSAGLGIVVDIAADDVISELGSEGPIRRHTVDVKCPWAVTRSASGVASTSSICQRPVPSRQRCMFANYGRTRIDGIRPEAGSCGRRGRCDVS
jgi:hypothetical protein